MTRPDEAHVVLEGEAAERFAAMLKHNETCLGAKADPPCEPCARRHETLHLAREMVKRHPDNFSLGFGRSR